MDVARVFSSSIKKQGVPVTLLELRKGVSYAVSGFHGLSITYKTDDKGDFMRNFWVLR